MENCVKAILYCYPMLERISEGYLQHIKNKATMSHDGRTPTVALAEYLAREICEKEKVQVLKALMDKVLARLTLEERLLLELRYFGKIDRVRRLFAAKKAGLADDYMRDVPIWSERTYFRKQKAALKKVEKRLEANGLDKDVFLKEYAELDGIAPVYQYVSLGKDVGIEKKERAFLDFLNEIR